MSSLNRGRRYATPTRPCQGARYCALLFFVAALVTGCDRDAKVAEMVRGAKSLGVHRYSTSFSKTENPISENGVWVTGSSAGSSILSGGHSWMGGRLWGDVQTFSGFAAGVDEPTQFGDPTAILAGNWGPNQTVAGVVRIANTPKGGCCHEVELRLRTTVSQFSITGMKRTAA